MCKVSHLLKDFVPRLLTRVSLLSEGLPSPDPFSKAPRSATVFVPINVDGHKLLIQAICRRLHVSGVNAAECH